MKEKIINIFTWMWNGRGRRTGVGMATDGVPGNAERDRGKNI
jgi:hypothetical protein